MIEETQIRYFVVHPNHITGKWSFTLYPDNDFLAIGEIAVNAKAIYPRLEFGQTDENIRVLSVLISKELEEEFAWQVDLENPMSDESEMETVNTLDIADKTFRSLETVKIAHPETIGTFEVGSTDEDGVETIIVHSKMKATNWAL